ncbi:MAG: non-homologous end-joining DNA ligase [Candidatus Korobacteraceae bacterium]|jgi:bifunctional non-homologous end joining protein LigD
MPKDTVVDVEGKHLKLSNLDKVLYPEAGFTKGQVIDYYVRIAPVLLPHLHGRPLTMKRYPNGVNGMFFYEKNCPSHRPEWVKTVRVWSEGNNRWMDYCLFEDLPTLVWAANLADLELHTSLSLGKEILRPTVLVFDLDPGAPANIVQCCRVGLWVRNIFAKLKLQSFAKTSGSKGLQIYVPLNTAVTYEQTKSFAHELARLLERQHPQLVVSDMKKSLRTNKVLVDWSQNDDHKTTVCVYSLRAKQRPTASTPVKWEEAEDCLRKGDPSLLVFEAGEVLERAKKYGDLFAPVLKLKQKMPPLEALQGMGAGRAVTTANPAKLGQRESASSRTTSAKAKRTSTRKAASARKRG